MSHFLQNIIQRHNAAPPNTVAPRLNGVFEFNSAAPEMQSETPEFDTGQAPAPPRSDIFTNQSTPARPVSNPVVAPAAKPQQRAQPGFVERHFIEKTAWTAPAAATPAIVSEHPFPEKAEKTLQTPEIRQQTIEAITQYFQRDAAAAAEQQDQRIALQLLPTLPPPLSDNSPATSGKSAEAPIVKIHIGRIEIKAVQPPPAPARRTSPAPQAALSLEDYLKARKG